MAHEQDDGPEGEAFTEVRTLRRQNILTPICRSSETPGGSQWEEWVSANDPSHIVTWCNAYSSLIGAHARRDEIHPRRSGA